MDKRREKDGVDDGCRKERNIMKSAGSRRGGHVTGVVVCTRACVDAYVDEQNSKKNSTAHAHIHVRARNASLCMHCYSFVSNNSKQNYFILFLTHFLQFASIFFGSIRFY